MFVFGGKGPPLPFLEALWLSVRVRSLGLAAAVQGIPMAEHLSYVRCQSGSFRGCFVCLSVVYCAGLYTGSPAGQECALPTEQELQASPSDLITISQKTVLWIYLPI